MAFYAVSGLKVQADALRSGGRRASHPGLPAAQDPSDVFDWRAMYGSRITLPELRLMAAVLQDAVHTYRRHVGATSREARALCEEARAWLVSHDETWPFSFVNVCQALGLHPDALRRRLFGQPGTGVDFLRPTGTRGRADQPPIRLKPVQVVGP